jgi:hypothetical protein
VIPIIEMRSRRLISQEKLIERYGADMRLPDMREEVCIGSSSLSVLHSILYADLPPRADMRHCKSNVRFGSKADICAAKFDVRFAPNSDRESGLSRKAMSAIGTDSESFA